MNSLQRKETSDQYLHIMCSIQGGGLSAAAMIFSGSYKNDPLQI